jgi:hypothetical protein
MQQALPRAYRWQPRQNEVTNPPGLTSLIRVPQRGHGCPPLSWTASQSRACFSKVGGTRGPELVDCSRHRLAGGRVEGVDLVRAEVDRFRNGSSRAAWRISSL